MFRSALKAAYMQKLDADLGDLAAQMRAYAPSSAADRTSDAFHNAGRLAGRMKMGFIILDVASLREIAGLALACEVKFQSTFEGTSGTPSNGQYASDFMFLLKEASNALNAVERADASKPNLSEAEISRPKG